MDNICHCITTTLESFCGNSTVKSCCLGGLHSADGFQCLLMCRWVIMNWHVQNSWLWQIRWGLTIIIVENRAEVLLSFNKKIFVTLKRSAVSHLDFDFWVLIFPKRSWIIFINFGLLQSFALEVLRLQTSLMLTIRRCESSSTEF